MEAQQVLRLSHCHVVGPFLRADAPPSRDDIPESRSKGGHEAQLNWLRDRAGGEQGVGRLASRVGSAVQAPVKLVSDGV
jgi:hypothetical protein